MHTLAYILGIASIFFTALPFIKTKAGWIRILDFPRAQIASLCIISLGLFGWVFDFKDNVVLMIMVLVAAALAYQFSQIIQFTFLYPVQAKRSRIAPGENSFSIIQFNVRMENRDVDRFMKTVKKYDPDIVSINEPDVWWEEQIAELDSIYPYSIKKPLPNTYGMMLYSKFPFTKKEINFLVEEDVPSFFATIQLPSGKEFDLYCLHPKPPTPGTETFERDTELIIVGNNIRKLKRPSVVVGDLNDVAWSYTSKRFQKFAEVLDPRQGRGLFNTYNVFVPLFRYPLDHFFYTRHFGLLRLRKLRAIGSDHFPMLIQLNLEKS